MSARQGSSRVSAASCVVDYNHEEVDLSVMLCEQRLPSKQLGATSTGVIRLHHSRRLGWCRTIEDVAEFSFPRAQVSLESLSLTLSASFARRAA